jgi:alanine racemase
MDYSIPPIESGGHLIIDLDALTANWKLLAAKSPHAECSAVVKADAYGISIEVAAPALAEAGCKTFFVAHLSEAKKLRAILSDVTIYVLNELFPQTAEVYKQLNVQPVLGSIAECIEWASFSGNDVGAALHIDTGMNRLGLRIGEFEDWLSQFQEELPFKVTLLMSHLACAHNPNHPLNAKQIESFDALRKKLPMIRASLANSSGIFLGPETHHELLRPGYALYGGNPTPGKPNPMLPVITLLGRIIELRDVFEGESIGYDASFRAFRDMRIATISVGYADGLLRSSGQFTHKRSGEVVFEGQRCPFVGRVSMDLSAVDVTHIPRNAIQRGDFVEILGETISIDELAESADTIGYEVLTSLGRRYTRQVKTAQSTPNRLHFLRLLQLSDSSL